MSKRLFKDCMILDGTLNMTVKEHYDILVDHDTIIKIAPRIEDKDAKVYDMKGSYVVPGLINMHVHLPAGGKISKKKVANQTALVGFISKYPLTQKIGIQICHNYALLDLYSGTTTVRAVGGITDFDGRLRDSINSGKTIGPRIISCNEAIGVKGGHMDGTVSRAYATLEDAVKQVDVLKAQHADWVKIMITGGVLDATEVGHPGVLKMPAEWVKAICDKAHSVGLRVCAHDEGPEGIDIAIKNGVDTIEHGSLVDETLLPSFKARNGALVCTLSPAVPLSFLDPSVTGYDETCKINSNALFNNMVDMTNKCLQYGVKVGLGTDTGCPFITHYDMWRELVYFTKYIKNVTPNFALHTATLVNAEILGLDKQIGSIEEGKFADFFFIKSNPLEDLKVLANPLMVVKNGYIYTKKVKKYQNVEDILNTLI